MECKFCQAEMERTNDTGIRFLCGTYTGPAFFEGPFVRSDSCKNIETFNLKKLLREAVEVIAWVERIGPIAIENELYYANKAAALLPKIQKVVT